jgi:hypothetical protein
MANWKRKVRFFRESREATKTRGKKTEGLRKYCTGMSRNTRELGTVSVEKMMPEHLTAQPVKTLVLKTEDPLKK